MALPLVSMTGVIGAAVAGFILQWLYYSPGLFGKTWIKLSGMTKAQVKKTYKEGMGKSMFWGFVSMLIFAYVLGAFVKYAGATSYGTGATIGFWAWLGFIGTVTLGSVLWEKKPFGMWVLNNGSNLIGALVMGAILGVYA